MKAFYPPYTGNHANFVGGTLEQLKAEVKRLDDQDYDQCRVELLELAEELHGDMDYFSNGDHGNVAAQEIYAKMEEIETEQAILESLQPITQ